jgi:hypothetical protein
VGRVCGSAVSRPNDNLDDRTLHKASRRLAMCPPCVSLGFCWLGSYCAVLRCLVTTCARLVLLLLQQSWQTSRARRIAPNGTYNQPAAHMNDPSVTYSAKRTSFGVSGSISGRSVSSPAPAAASPAPSPISTSSTGVSSMGVCCSRSAIATVVWVL